MDYTTLESLTADTLPEITRLHGIDFATALIFDRFKNAPQRMPFIERINGLREAQPQQGRAKDVKIVIIPGALYVERPDIGGDGRLVREVSASFGWRTDLIPVVSVGPIAENARRICDWLAQHADEKIILISLSKGGSDLKMAFNSPNASDLFRNVFAWVNVCGPLNGSRMANWILASQLRTQVTRLQYKLQRRDFRFVTDLQHGVHSLLDFPLQLPPHLKMMSMIGFPLRAHFSTPFSRFCQRSLAKWGPNDGTISLSDLRDWPGEIYPVWGMDHYFRPENEAKILVAAMFAYLDDEIALNRTHETTVASTLS